MTRILSSGTAMTIATAAGDAGQFGMAAGFLGGLANLIRLPHATRRAATGNFTGGLSTGGFRSGAGDRGGFTVDADGRDDLSLVKDFGGDRPWTDLGLTGRALAGVTAGFRTLVRTGQRTLWPFRHYLSWHSVYQH